ncbi:uncharacterized protein PG986_007463 [Apiospora aurea]|uniref:RING-type domain-containing protein n=1 Tax=Apiospora aurea TaxID=335848 RepID=A0ABR1QE10_9PEZI
MSLAEPPVASTLAVPDRRQLECLESLDDEGVPDGTGQRSALRHVKSSPQHLGVSQSSVVQHDHSFVELKSPRNKHGDAHAITRDRRRGHNCKLDLSECSACGPRVTGLRGSFSIEQIRNQPTSGQPVPDQSAMGTVVNHRRSARELFEQYGVARPSGWLSDEEDLILSGDRNASPRRFCRICHICSARTWSPRACSACGHRFCERCLCEVSEDSEETHVRFSHHPSRTIKEGGAKYRPPPLTTPESQSRRQQTSQVLHTEVKSQSHQQSAGSRHTVWYEAQSEKPDRIPVQAASSGLGHRHNASEAAQSPSASETNKQSMASVGTERNPLRPHLRADTLRSHPTWSVKQNPFLIADREAKSKASEPGAAGNGAKARQSRNVAESAVRHTTHTGASGDEDAECENPACRATHEGHRPFRHSVFCALYRSSQDEDVYTSPRGLVVEQSQQTNGGISKSRLAEQPSSAVEALHSRHDTIHRHHSPGFHGPHHIAEHLALAVGHNLRRSQSNSAGKATGQSVVEEIVKGSEVRESRAESTEQYATKQLEPLTQVQATTKVDSFRYTEEPLPHGHPPSEEHRYTSASAETVLDDDIPRADSELAEHESELHETHRTLRHVQRSQHMRRAAGEERPSPVGDNNVPRGTPSRSPFRVIKRMGSTAFAGQGASSGEGKFQRRDETPLSTREAEEPGKPNCQARLQAKTKHIEQTTKHTERTLHKEVQNSSGIEASSHGKTLSAALGARSDSDRQSHVSDERIAFNGQERGAAPKSRVASPPPWLKNPSKKPANVQDRLRHVDTRSQYGLSRASREQYRRVDRPNSSTRSHDPSQNTPGRLSSPKSDLQNASKDPQRTVHTQDELDTWLGLPSGLQQQDMASKSSAAQLKHTTSQEEAPIPVQRSSSHHKHGSDYTESCIFCEAPSPTSPHMRGPHERNAGAPSPSVVSSSNNPSGKANPTTESVESNYRRATLRAQEQLGQLFAETRYSSHRQGTVETRATASGFTATPLPRRQVSFQDEEEAPRVDKPASNYENGNDELSSFSSKGSNPEIHRPTPIAPPNHECRWKDRYMALTSEIRQLKAEMSTRESFHDADADSARDQGSQQQDEDLGIQGLTIVMHLKGKDDLVINTDLTQEAEEVEE